MPAGVEVRHALGLLSGPECLELGQGAAKPDRARRSVYEVDGNKKAITISFLMKIGDSGWKVIRLKGK